MCFWNCSLFRAKLATICIGAAGNAKKNDDEQGHPQKTEKPAPFWVQAFRCGWAANYFSTVSRSIIVAAGLNFSVRNGKRCAPAP